MRQSSRHSVSGFTLIEAMVVLVIFGLVIAAAVPNFAQSNQRRQVEAAARDLSARIQIARQRAIATRVPHRLLLVPDENLYRTEWMADDSTWARFPDEDYPIPPAVDWWFTAGGEHSNTDIEFENRGTVQADDAPLIVSFANAHSDTFTLSLVRTGRVVVRAGGP